MLRAIATIMVLGLVSVPAGAVTFVDTNNINGFENYTATNADDFAPSGGWEAWISGSANGGIYNNQNAPQGNNVWGSFNGSTTDGKQTMIQKGLSYDRLTAYMRIDAGGSNGATKVLSGPHGGDLPELSLNMTDLDWDAHDGGGWNRVFGPGGSFSTVPGKWYKVELDLMRDSGFARVRVDDGPWNPTRKYNRNDDPLPLPLQENVYVWVHNADGGVDFVFPEPATIGLLTLGGLLSVTRRRRSQPNRQ